MKSIESFRGEYDFLSNFYVCPFGVYYEGIMFPTSEHAFQAAKTLDMGARKAFALDDMTPGEAKRLGRALAIRPNWELIKLEIMREILTAKFFDVDLRQKLVATGDAELIEGNTWGDTYWGICNGKGNNFLGKLLMELRKSLTTPTV